MRKNNNGLLMLISALLLPVVPMLYLYNQNAKYLSLFQVAVAALFLAAAAAAFFILFRLVFRSGFIAFCACFVMVVLIFAFNSLYYKYLYTFERAYITLLAVPAAAYVVAFVLKKLIKEGKYENVSKPVCIILSLVLVMNLFGFVNNSFSSAEMSGSREYKTSFATDETLPSPNVYWILCDGMLGFDAMSKYFKDPQKELTAELEGRGFYINKSAMFESGHFTKIAIPELMCPEYCDKYLTPVLNSHTTAMKYRDNRNTDLYNACYYNETIKAFDSKDYTTVSISINEDYFFPTTDYFYYITTPFISDNYDKGVPYYVKSSDFKNSSYLKSKFNVQHLSDIFLGGIPYIVFNRLNKSNIIKHQLSATVSNIDEILPGSVYAKKNATLINSIYDSLHSEEIKKPEFVLIHNFMAHFPICFDENGNIVSKQDSIEAYPGHHTYAENTLIDIVDMILNVDSSAVIILQADHGVHIWDEEKIEKAFGSPDAAIDIWNNVFSAVRIPDKYKNGDEIYAERNPLNMSRYLVNSFVGKNYAYVEG